MKAPELYQAEWEQIRDVFVQAVARREQQERQDLGDIQRTPQLKVWQGILAKWKD